MFQNFVQKIIGNRHLKKIATYQPVIDVINGLETEIALLTDDQLKSKTDIFKKKCLAGDSLDKILPEAFAVVREAAKRTLNMRHFDVQLMGGIALHEGNIAEMKTGEGKTLVATLAAYLNALDGNGVYIVTVNDYLAKRDFEWMGQVYTFLGLTVGLIQANMDPEIRRDAYACDITFGTNNEYGFDYLRDNLSTDISQCSQTRKHYAIIDEVDSILIDEARTPLIISGPIKNSTSKYLQVSRIVRRLEKETHFTLDEKHKNAVLTEEGVEKIEKDMGISNMYSVQYMEVAHMSVQCLKALHLFKKDTDYVVKDGEVLIVDEFTGRLMEGRRYSDGLHQAIEAMENLSIRDESQTLASITFQNYFRMFSKLSGMTGTAITEADEFLKIYNLDVVIIPTHKPMVRKDLPDIIYKNKQEKYKAIISEIKACYEKSQPVLVGTIAIETSELLSSLLKKERVPHNVLNAKQHEMEATIISNAGLKKNITIATNMAGRGTDIVLGENVQDIGGLHVIGSERHESRRIDNQLRGRSGRQGDPGSSRFYVSLDDDLMRLFGSGRIATVMDKLGLPPDTPIEHGLISKSIERAQSKVEKYHFGIRKQILQYDDVMTKQRETIYTLRNQILKKEGLDAKMKDLITDIVRSNLAMIEEENTASKETQGDAQKQLTHIFPIPGLFEHIQDLKTLSEKQNHMIKECYAYFVQRKSDHPSHVFEDIQKLVFLRTLDQKWMAHLHNMDILREGIGLRAWGNKDPLLEYKIEGYDMFKDLLLSTAEEVIEVLIKVQLVAVNPADTDKSDPIYYNHSESTPQKIGRNDLCHCGSGKKYKKCCMT
ncbi:MAG: preprotein translocase subunit SecA [Candidatus Margulisbacteria bacterium]|nr:preprotein translocase subunit SecA [Candidatus Margulisiibacteriota bacterium]